MSAAKRGVNLARRRVLIMRRRRHGPPQGGGGWSPSVALGSLGGVSKVTFAGQLTSPR